MSRPPMLRPSTAYASIVGAGLYRCGSRGLAAAPWGAGSASRNVAALIDSRIHADTTDEMKRKNSVFMHVRVCVCALSE